MTDAMDFISLLGPVGDYVEAGELCQVRRATLRDEYDNDSTGPMVTLAWPD